MRKESASAVEAAQRRAADLLIEPDAIAVISRDQEGRFHVTTNHHAVGGGATLMLMRRRELAPAG